MKVDWYLGSTEIDKRLVAGFSGSRRLQFMTKNLFVDTIGLAISLYCCHLLLDSTKSLILLVAQWLVLRLWFLEVKGSIPKHQHSSYSFFGTTHLATHLEKPRGLF